MLQWLPYQQEKGNTPLHVAAKAGQVSQAELLTVYGADPGAPDSNGYTPIDYARYYRTDTRQAPTGLKKNKQKKQGMMDAAFMHVQKVSRLKMLLFIHYSFTLKCQL